MKLILFACITAILIFKTPAIHCQNTAALPDAAYGLDPLLYNGTLYTYVPPLGTDGTPFFHKSGYVNGSVKLRGIIYENLFLKYDLYHQQVILKYSFSVFQIALSNAWLESFELDDMHFEVLQIEDTLKLSYQVIGQGTNKIIYFFNKDLALDIRMSTSNYLFSEVKRDNFIYTGTKKLKYKNNKTFVSYYNSSNQATLKKFMRQHKINVKKADVQAMTELIDFCNTLQIL